MLHDRTQRKKIVTGVKHCITPAQKARGLMFSLPIKDKALVFHFDPPKRVDLHMMFVFFPIDVLFLDKGRKVVEMKERFLPFTLYMSRKKANYAVELPAGTILAKKIRIGHGLNF